jgi:hypothetical protein
MHEFCRSEWAGVDTHVSCSSIMKKFPVIWEDRFYMYLEGCFDRAR